MRNGHGSAIPMKKLFLTITMAGGLAVSQLSGEPARIDAPAPKLNRIAESGYELHGVPQEYLAAVTENWLLKLPDTNPAILEMLADRDKVPHRDLLPWSGEFAGKYLTGATQVLRLTHDPALKEHLATFVANLVRLQAEDGYLGPFPRDNRLEGTGGTWDVWGHYHIMLGLLLWHQDTGDPQALQCAVKIGDLMCRKFLRTGKRVVDTGSVEMNHAAIHSLCLLYKVTKTPAHLELARQIADEEFQDKRAGDFIRAALDGREFYQTAKPRWESLHSLQGIAELYWITGDENYRKAFERLWWSIAKLDRHNNGGFSSGEQAQGNPYHRGAIETCCTVAWIAMSVDMLRLTGNSIVADELELSTLNQVLGYQNRSGKWCTYNTPMEGTRQKSTEQIAFQIRPGSEEINCCSANAPRGLGMISDWALMTDGQGLIVNWFGPSTLSATLKNERVAITQQTDYPRGGRITLTVSPRKTLAFPLKLRIPHWSAKSSVRVNGKPVDGVTPGQYLVLDREWKPGDTVEMNLDMSLHYWAGERECAGTVSIYHGPLLLVHEVDRRDKDIKFSPEWKRREDMAAITKDIGASLDAVFEGASVTWNGWLFDDAGQAQVTIDGRNIAIVDQYGPTRGEPFRWEYHGLQPGKHLLKITLLAQKNAQSKDHWINVGRIVPPAPLEPVFDAAKMDDHMVTMNGARPPMLVMECATTDGHTVPLRDFATAGEEGLTYASWLKVQNMKPIPFSETNPWRSGRPTP
jgi:DUF1680 family protein